MAAGSKRVVYAALAGNLAIAVTKFIAAAITGSSAMLSEGVHSVVDTGNQALLLYGMRRAKVPADERFPFGRGKEIYFWSFVVALLVFALGAGISFYQGVHHLLYPAEVERPYVNYFVLAFAAIFEFGSWWVAFSQFSPKAGERGVLVRWAEVWKIGEQIVVGSDLVLRDLSVRENSNKHVHDIIGKRPAVARV